MRGDDIPERVTIKPKDAARATLSGQPALITAKGETTLTALLAARASPPRRQTGTLKFMINANVRTPAAAGQRAGRATT